MQELPDELKTPLCELVLAIADDKLMLGHRASDWTGLAPILEEDIAFSAISQEEIAHATELYKIVGSLRDMTADAVAFGRRPDEYRCAALATLDDEFDWAKSIARHLFCDHLDILRFERLARSQYAPLAALAKRIHAEEAAHVEHAHVWLTRLGRGGDESSQRFQAALDELAAHAGMLFENTDGVEKLEQAGIYPQGDVDMFERWYGDLRKIISDVGLRLDVRAPGAGDRGGRHGVHGDDFTALLDEMCEVYRVEPEAVW